MPSGGGDDPATRPFVDISNLSLKPTSRLPVPSSLIAPRRAMDSLGGSYGLLYIGTIVASVSVSCYLPSCSTVLTCCAPPSLYGITILQTFEYYDGNNEDSMWLKLTVCRPFLIVFPSVSDPAQVLVIWFVPGAEPSIPAQADPRVRCLTQGPRHASSRFRRIYRLVLPGCQLLQPSSPR